ATASMAHGEGDLGKLAYARMLAAALAFLALRQGDAVALHLVGSTTVDLPPLRRRRALERLLFHLETMEAGGRWPSWQRPGPAAAQARGGRRDLRSLGSRDRDRRRARRSARAAPRGRAAPPDGARRARVPLER